MALVEYFTALLVLIFCREHPLQEVSIIVFVITDGGRMVLYDFLVFVLHQLLSTLKDSSATKQISVHPVQTPVRYPSSVELICEQ